MAKKKEFGDRNKTLSNQLLSDKIYYDWVVTTAFYSTIHYVEDHILPTKIGTKDCNCIAQVKKAYSMRGRHEARERLVFDNLGPKIGARYKWLDDRSRNSRYETFKLQASEALKAKEYLDYIFSELYEENK
ncbi:hypothetical protein [Winogradskyella sp. SM1960]|uniref:hypothetical protein n=1 Tax=Winogradskyella sp. SM1960 TaxID=2865955 RepID=UPI001CD1D860|nr:hypothetical protein [Winogradskyella sp. SM1960]